MIDGWAQIAGSVHVLPARRGDEPGSYLWISAGERREAVVAELFLPAVAPDRLDCAIGVAVASIARTHTGEERSGPLRVQFGRVRDGRGVVSLEGAGLDADVAFSLVHGPPGGGFCSHCGDSLEFEVVDVIAPPDGGLIARVTSRCRRCGR